MKKVVRLFDQFKPVHYILDLVPDREAMTFTGSVIISGQKVGRPTQRLTFHQKDLKVTSAHVTHHAKTGDKEIEIDRINAHKAYDEVRLHAKTMVYPGNYTVRLEFVGKITRPMNGMYPCTFTHDGVEKTLIATQFESHHAREVFPGIDEPEAKATFDFSITTPKGEAVVANTPIKEQNPVKGNSGLVHTTFETTPHMSTYLLAFVYGDMKYLEAKTKRGVTVRTYATPDNVAFTDFALDTAVQCLDFYADYFAIDYPLAKCDMIALPEFASGAMENWGCITYREQTLLVDPKNTSVGMKQYVAMVVAHELTHQWFGNLVTMKWWTDLWLNEGFASWFEYLAVDHLYPNWKMWTQFIVDEQHQAFRNDALEFTHPIEVPVNHPDEIRTIFDAISYQKGASIIHMLYNYLGADDFQTGMRYYLKKHAYKNTETVDLWDAFEEASHKPVKQFMHAWTSEPGFPLLEVSSTEDAIEISQRRFVLNPTSTVHDSEQLWPVPLLSNDDRLPAILDQQLMALPLSEPGAFRINVGASGFYRAIYNASHLQALEAQLKAGHLEPLDRLGLLADLSEAAKAGIVDVTEALSLLEAYKDEDDNAVWDVMASLLGSIRQIVADEETRELMKPFVRSLVAKQVKRLGWESKPHESHFDRLLRPTVLGIAAVSDEPNITKEALEKFADIHASNELKSELKSVEKPLKALDPELRGVVYGTVARLGGEAEFNKLLAMHNSTNSNEEKLNLCAALCSFKQTKLIKKALALITTKDVRLQDVTYWLAYSFTNRHAHQLTWEWTKENWQWIHDNLGSDLSFYRLPVFAARGSSDKTFLVDYKKFFGKVLSPAMERAYNQGIEFIEWQSAWKERDLKLVKAYFSSKS